jgi:hypothetical protein
VSELSLMPTLRCLDSFAFETGSAIRLIECNLLPHVSAVL